MGTNIATTGGLGTRLRLKRLTVMFGSAAVMAALLLIHLSLIDYAHDDAYIHVRIAGNLLEQGEPYFNLGEAVKGSSSTLWTLVLAFVFRFTGIAMWPIAVLNSLLLVGNGVVYGVLTSTAFPQRRLLPWAAGSLVVAALLPTSVGLMETGLAIFLIGIAWILLQRENPAGFAVGAVAVFARPEMAIFVAAAVVVALATSSFRLRTIALAGGVASLPFLIFDLAFYQTPIPHAAVAKSIVFPLTAFESLDLTRFPMSRIFAFFYLLLGLLAVALLWVAPPSSDRWTKWLLVSFSAAGSTILVTYVFTGTFVFAWYTPLYIVPVVLNGVWIAAYIRRPIPLLAAVALWLPTLWFSSMTVLDAVDQTRLLQPLNPNARVGQFRAVAEVLRAECPTCDLLAPEIGALGYQFEGYIVDAVGLVTPEALKYHPMKVSDERANRYLGAIPVGLVAESRPEFIVSLSGFAQSLLKSSLSSEYRIFSCPVAQPDGSDSAVTPSIWGMTELFVMVRQDQDALGSAVLAGTREFGCAARAER